MPHSVMGLTSSLNLLNSLTEAISQGQYGRNRRWLGTLAVASIYVLRVYYLRGFHIVSYGLGIYILNLLIGFLSPKVDPEIEALDGASLPTKDSDEFKPFIRRLPEFKFCQGV
ncbi:hypothetical protein F0562_003753 [Nyssa sinensis]|uniref:Protein RER1 n=1 Tax=Nyssa sinensis TaxID=561372 RepID=A0A5J5BW91_9ASTE|nr:hypothetical protein F0562_003753 [Nyssa sinensis]